MQSSLRNTSRSVQLIRALGFRAAYLRCLASAATAVAVGRILFSAFAETASLSRTFAVRGAALATFALLGRTLGTGFVRAVGESFEFERGNL